MLHAVNRILDDRMLEQVVASALQAIRAGQAKLSDEQLAIERQLSLIEAPTTTRGRSRSDGQGDGGRL